MGALCSTEAKKSLKLLAKTNYNSVLNTKTNLNDLYSSDNMIIIGPPDSGKTLLWTRIIYPSVFKDDAKKICVPTKFLHVERLIFDNYNLLVWDISGDAYITKLALDSLAHFSIITIISILPINIDPKYVQSMKKTLFELAKNILFTKTKFYLIINIQEANYVDNELSEITLKNICGILIDFDITQLQKILGERFNWNYADVSSGIDDPYINEIIYNVQQKN